MILQNVNAAQHKNHSSMAAGTCGVAANIAKANVGCVEAALSAATYISTTSQDLENRLQDLQLAGELEDTHSRFEILVLLKTQNMVE